MGRVVEYIYAKTEVFATCGEYRKCHNWHTTTPICMPCTFLTKPNFSFKTQFRLTYQNLTKANAILYNLCCFRMIDPMFSLLYPILSRYMTGFQRFQRKINSLAKLELVERIMAAKKSKDGFILINQKIVNQLHLQLNAKCQFQKLIKDH